MIAATLLAAAPFEDSPFWNPDLPGSFWSVFGILLAGTAVLTIAFVVWMVIQPDEPEHDTTELVDYDEATFEAIRTEFTDFAAKLEVHDVTFVPLSAPASLLRRASAEAD